MVTGSFYADSDESEKKNVSKSSIAFIQEFLKEEAMPISLAVLNVAGIYKFFGKEFAALAISGIGLCVVRMYMDKKNLHKKNQDAKKSK